MKKTKVSKQTKQSINKAKKEARKKILKSYLG